MKDYIEKQNPKVHRSYIKLRKLVIEEWNSILEERIRELVSGDSIPSNPTRTIFYQAFVLGP
jgi:hypothetical protein